MDRLGELEAFVAVVETGGFTDAAKRLGLSKSAISKHVAALEARLSARLLDRTTRQVIATDIGRAFFDKARAILDASSEAEAMVGSMQSSPKGILNVSAAVDFGAQVLPDIIASFLAKYPDVSVRLSLSNARVDLIEDRFDLALRIGPLADSSLHARKLATVRQGLFAASEYIEQKGVPKKIADLTDHDLLFFSHTQTDGFWSFTDENGEFKQIQVNARFAVNEGLSLLRIVERGVGIAGLPCFVYADALAQGKLVQILPNTASDLLDVHAVFPSAQFIQPKLRAFIDHLVEAFKGKGDGVW